MTYSCVTELPVVCRQAAFFQVHLGGHLSPGFFFFLLSQAACPSWCLSVPSSESAHLTVPLLHPASTSKDFAIVPVPPRKPFHSLPKPHLQSPRLEKVDPDLALLPFKIRTFLSFPFISYFFILRLGSYVPWFEISVLQPSSAHHTQPRKYSFVLTHTPDQYGSQYGKRHENDFLQYKGQEKG